MRIINKINKIGGKRKKGFTLIEIIVAVTIIIILSALAVPKVSGYISKANDAKVISKGKQIYNASMWSYAEQGNKFVVGEVSKAITKTTSITIADNSVTASSDGNSAEIIFRNDGKDYLLSIKEGTNTYTIADKLTPTLTIFDSKEVEETPPTSEK